MRILFFILFNCSAGLCIAQDTLSRWSWGVVGGVDVCGRQLESQSNDQTALDTWNSLEKGVYRLTGSFRLQRDITSHVAFYTGLGYVNRGYSIDTLADAGLNSLSFHYRYVDVPLGIVFNTHKAKRNSLVASAAITGLIGLNNSLYYYKDGQTARFEMQAVPEMNRFVLNVSAVLGVRRAITNTANLDIYVSGNQALSALAAGSLERRLNAVGIYVSVMSRF